MARATYMIIFLGIFAFLLALTHFYILQRLSYYLQLTGGQFRLATRLLASLALLTLIAVPLGRVLPREAARVLDWIIFPWLGFAMVLLIVLFVTDACWFLSQLIPSALKYDAERRAFFERLLGVTALGSAGLLGGFSLWNGLRPVMVKPLTVELKRLPRSLDGLRIVQITDLHIGPLIDGGWLRQVVDKVNALKPDIIVVTGDLVDGSVEELSRHVAPMADLVAPQGVYFVTGNHEYYSGVEPWCAHIASLGLRVLRNECVSINAGSNGDSFDLAGVDDWRSNQFPGQGADLPKALAGRDTDKMLILLAHQPVAIHEAAAHGVDLQLSGHTHGGQIWPYTYLVYLQQPYAEGLHRYRKTSTQIYVSPGTGFWGPPMRLGTAAEITHITLRTTV
jgi:uncharacterized protein